jgi:hypothetical protein
VEILLENELSKSVKKPKEAIKEDKKVTKLEPRTEKKNEAASKEAAVSAGGLKTPEVLKSKIKASRP